MTATCYTSSAGSSNPSASSSASPSAAVQDPDPPPHRGATRARPYNPCSFPGYGKTFARLYSLCAHTRVHSAESPFRCYYRLREWCRCDCGGGGGGEEEEQQQQQQQLRRTRVWRESFRRWPPPHPVVILEEGELPRPVLAAAHEAVARLNPVLQACVIRASGSVPLVAADAGGGGWGRYC